MLCLLLSCVPAERQLQQADDGVDGDVAFDEAEAVGNRAGTGHPEEDPKCRAAGFYSHSFEEDKYELERWQNEYRHDPLFATPSSTCKSATVNARGVYTSHLVPCTFQFHHSEIDENDLSPFVMSEACTLPTSIAPHNEPIESYVVRWPDECVADFSRCYILQRDKKILARHMCKYDWKYPEGATHVSVDCTADKKEKKKRIDNPSEQNINDPYMKQVWQQEERKRHELYAVLFAALLLCLCAGFCFFGCAHRHVIQPYFATIKKSRSDPELKRLAEQDTEKGI